MSTQATFNEMLKKYMPYAMLEEEITKRDYFLTKVDKDNDWMGGEMEVAFSGGKASSIAYGELTDEDKITEDCDVKGSVATYKEIWGSMIFNDKDLQQHGNLEQSFIKVLPNKLETFIDNMKEAVSVNLLNGTHIVNIDLVATAALDVASPLAGGSTRIENGIVVVDRIARMQLGQFVELGLVGTSRIDNSGEGGAYIAEINISDKTVRLVKPFDTKSILPADLAEKLPGPIGAAVLDLTLVAASDMVSAVAAGDRLFARAGTVAGRGLTSLRDQLLSQVNGGTAQIFGINKLSYPHLQTPNFDASGGLITAVNILDKIFDFHTETRILGKGAPTDAIMSYRNLAHVMKNLEHGRGPAGDVGESGRRFVASDTRASIFGWTEIDIIGVTGKLTVVGVQEMDDDLIYLMDWRAVKLHSNGMFERRESPDGNSFYEIRKSTGYKYIVDTRFFGELVVSKPSHCGIIFGISIP